MSRELEVRLLGGLADRARTRRLQVVLPDEARAGDVRAAVAEAAPAVAGLLDAVKVAVDLETVDDDAPVPPGAEVALLPPVAGGSDAGTALPPVRVDDDGRRRSTGLWRAGAVSADAVGEAIAGPATGAVVSFVGRVRDHAPDLAEQVVALDYEAYEPMAERVLDEIAGELLAERDDLQGIGLWHAVGALEVGAATIVVAAAAAHRATAFDAASEGLERTKDRVPVFKRERTAGGGHRWVGLPPA